MALQGRHYRKAPDARKVVVALVVVLPDRRRAAKSWTDRIAGHRCPLSGITGSPDGLSDATGCKEKAMMSYQQDYRLA
jgi:hypothetical protein